MARIEAARPRLITAVAPAGYGKSTVMRQYAGTLQSSAVCDCTNVRTTGDLAREVAASLALGDRALKAAVSQQRLAGADDEAWCAFAVDLWSSADRHEFFVFENAEHIADRLEHMEFLMRLLARTLPRSRIAICSRRALPISFTRFVAPHELMSLRSDDLCFDEGEIAAAFEGVDVCAQSIARITEITRGWPMAVLLLARLAREHSLSILVERVGGIAFDDLYDYLSEQVLAAMPRERFLRLVAVAAIPRATPNDVAAALADPDALIDLPALAKSSPFLYPISQTQYEAHPLVRAMIRDRHPGLCSQALRNAADALRSADPLRSAQLYLEAADDEAAASQLENASALLLTDMPPVFADISAKLTPEVLLRHPAVWSAATAVRATAVPHRQWLHEALVARDNLSSDAPLTVRLGVLSSLANVLTNLGRHEEALEIFRSCDEPDAPESYRLMARLFEAVIEARLGRFTRATEVWNTIEAAFADVKFTRAIVLEEIHARLSRYGGDRTAERMHLETAVALARESEAALAIALTLEEAAFAAWFAGEDLLYERYASELEATLAPNTARGTEVFRGCVRADYTALLRNEGVEHPKIHFYASLIACGNAPKARRSEFAMRALAASAAAREPMLETLAAIACAETGACDRREGIEKARSAARQVEAQALQDAVEAYAEGCEECGLLTPLLRRLHSEANADLMQRRSLLHVAILRGEVERGGAPIKLSNREMELVTYLASRRRFCASEEIVEALWDRDREDDTVLRVYVTRVRAKLGFAAIAASEKGYALDPAVTIDLDGFERALTHARRKSALAPPMRDELKSQFSALSRAMPPRMLRWKWFASTQLRVDDVLRETGLLLGRDALANKNVQDAMGFAERLLERDTCDEPARELLIRAHLAMDDRAGALRELRKYRKVLAAELGAEPSEAIEKLVSA